MFPDLVRRNRSYRRFYEEEPIGRETMLTLVDYARLAPSGSNRQALKFYISYEKELNEKVYPTLLWAVYLADWPGPKIGERPTGYFVIVQDTGYKIAAGVDHGIAAQTILLGATEMGLGGCIFANFRRPELKEALNIPENQEILLVIALGKPKETVVIDEIDAAGDIKYWRDDKQVHHVPKRKLADVVMN